MERELSGALPLVKAQEVHKVLRPAVEDVLQARGFARTAGTPHDLSPQRRGWWVAITGYHFAVVDLQLNPRGFSRHWGSRFTLNFELSPRPTPIESDYLRARLWKLLERGHRKRALEIQRKVVASLPEPPGAHQEKLLWNPLRPAALLAARGRVAALQHARRRAGLG